MKKLKLSKLFKTCYTLDYKVAGKDVNYQFVEDNNTLYIYWQGSSSITDWVRNFMFKKRPYKDMKTPYKVHRGFLLAWKEVEDIIINKITELDNKGLSVTDILKLNTPQQIHQHQQLQNSIIQKHYKWKHIIIVGYSHGGALSGLCHECVWYHRPDLRNNQNKLVGYGFESPRFFGGFKVPKDLQERWNTYFVIRTNNDLVTHCPPMITKYCHVGNLLKITGDATLVKKHFPKCIKSHYPEVVEDALVSYEYKLVRDNIWKKLVNIFTFENNDKKMKNIKEKNNE